MQCHSFLTLRKISFSYLVWPPATSESARALGWCACVHTCALLKWPPLPVWYEQKNALALQRSSFRENPTYFLTSVGSWVCELVFDAIYDWRSEFSHNRQTNTTTTVTLAAHARRGLITGVTAGNELSQVDDDVLVDPPQKKPKLNTSADVDIISKFNAFENKLDTLDKKIIFLR